MLADGTYNCIVIEFSDNIKFTPNATSTSGNCVGGAEETLDVCSSGSSTLIDGTTATCSTSENIVAMYLSTGSTSSNGSDAFIPPSSGNYATNGFNLGSALVVSGSSVANFVVNATDMVCDTAHADCNGSVANSCEMAAPAFTFVQQ